MIVPVASLVVAWIILLLIPVHRVDWLMLAFWSAALAFPVWLLGGDGWWMFPLAAWAALMALLVRL